MSKKLTEEERRARATAKYQAAALLRAQKMRALIIDFRCGGIDCGDCPLYTYPGHLGGGDKEETSCFSYFVAKVKVG